MRRPGPGLVLCRRGAARGRGTRPAAPLDGIEVEDELRVEHPARPGRAVLCAWAILTASLAILGAAVALKLDESKVLDDAYMFPRYARNLLRYGTLCWNPEQGATFGLTAPLFLAVVLPFQAWLPDEPGWVALSASVTSGAAFVALLLALVWRETEGPRVARWGALLLVAYSLTMNANSLTHQFVSGMDTPFALAFLTAFLWLALAQARRPLRARAVAMGLLGGVSLFVRPDVLLFTLGVPLGTAILAKRPEVRRQALLAAALAAGLTGLGLLAAELYFGSAVPLAFYAKGSRLYGDLIYERYRTTPRDELLQFVYGYRYLVLAALVHVLLLLRARAARAVDVALIACTAAFVLYYLFFVLQIMGRNARFYYPTLPGLAWLGASGMAHALRSANGVQRAASLRSTSAASLGTLLLVASMAPEAVRAWRSRVQDVSDAAEQWPGLRAFARLPSDLVIATSEVGLPGALNPDKAIIDMVGLNEPSIAREGFDARRFLAQHRPDVVYMFHQDYRSMIEELESDADFQADYDYYPADTLQARLGVAVRRDSRHFAELTRIIEGLRPARD